MSFNLPFLQRTRDHLKLHNSIFYTCFSQILMQMRHVLSATTGVLRSLTVEEAIENIVKEMAEAMEAERASVFLIDHDSDELWTKTLQGQEIRIPIGSGIAGFVARSGETLHIVNAYDDSRFNSSNDSKTGMSLHLYIIQQCPFFAYFATRSRPLHAPLF